MTPALVCLLPDEYGYHRTAPLVDLGNTHQTMNALGQTPRLWNKPVKGMTGGETREDPLATHLALGLQCSARLEGRHMGGRITRRQNCEHTVGIR